MSSEGPGPAVQRERLIQELKRLRMDKGETQEQVAKAREWSVSKFTRIENGNSPISKSDLEGLLRYYGVDKQDRIDELVAWARDARLPEWWTKFYNGEDKAFAAYLGWEDGASSIRMCQGLAIPGLLQTESYMRALMAAYNTDPKDVEQSVALRLERQKRISKRAPSQIYILDETIIRRPIGEEAADVKHDQLEHLRNVAQKPSVTIRIIPYTKGIHFGLKGSFVLLGFGSHLDDVLYLEGARRGDLLIGQREAIGPGAPDSEHLADELATYQDGFDSLLKIALEPDASLAVISEALDFN
jgi:transcriptional regulator with XRE-family HTH domain